MLLKAIYDAFDQIPEFARSAYKQNASGKWELIASEIEGGDAVFAAGLRENRDALLNEKKVWQDRASAAETRSNTLETELSKFKAPGAVILNGEDAKAWQKYTGLGSAKDLEEKLKTAEAKDQELTTLKADAAIRDVAGKCNLNAEALKDVMFTRSNGAQLVAKSVKVTDAAGKESESVRPYLVIRTAGTQPGTFQEKEVDLFAYATEQVWPKYLIDALQVQTGEKQNQNNLQNSSNQLPVFTQSPGIKVPAQTQSSQSGNQTPGQQTTNWADHFNQQRDGQFARNNPLVPAPSNQQTQQ